MNLWVVALGLKQELLSLMCKYHLQLKSMLSETGEGITTILQI